MLHDKLAITQHVEKSFLGIHSNLYLLSLQHIALESHADLTARILNQDLSRRLCFWVTNDASFRIIEHTKDMRTVEVQIHFLSIRQIHLSRSWIQHLQTLGRQAQSTHHDVYAKQYLLHSICFQLEHSIFPHKITHFPQSHKLI